MWVMLEYASLWVPERLSAFLTERVERIPPDRLRREELDEALVVAGTTSEFEDAASMRPPFSMR